MAKKPENVPSWYSKWLWPIWALEPCTDSWRRPTIVRSQSACHSRSSQSQEANIHPIYMSSSPSCWLEITLALLLTKWYISSWFVYEWAVTPVSTSRWSSIHDLLLTMRYQKWYSFSGGSISSPSKVLKWTRIGCATKHDCPLHVVIGQWNTTAGWRRAGGRLKIPWWCNPYPMISRLAE